MNDKDKNKKKTISFSVSLPEELNEKIEREAESQERSKNLQINWIVKKYYEQIETGQTVTAASQG